MYEIIKKLNEGKLTKQTTDDGKMVFFKREYFLDESTTPPTVGVGELKVVNEFTLEKIEAEIKTLESQIEILTNFKKML